MKHRIGAFLALLLGAALLSAPLPAASGVSAYELRQAVAGQARAIANVEWKLETRRSNSKLADEKKELMHAAGARSTTYYEYKRMNTGYLGPLTESNSVSLEAFKGQLADGYLPENMQDEYYGMNTDSFLADVLSRMIPTPILSVKDALTAPGLEPLFPGAVLNAGNSQAAAAKISYEDALTAYGKLELGDILLAWDDAADGQTAPRLHAMVVTEFDRENRGKVTVTYPACENAVYYFTCSRCGKASVEAPDGYPVTEHMVSLNSAFSRWKKHNETDPASSCTGEWIPQGGSTWRTETVSFDQLFGRGDAAVPGGGTCYLPYTLTAYRTGEVPPVQIRVTTDASAENIAAGFRAEVQSNWRIVRVDAVLSRPGKTDQVFTGYPAWDAWTYTYQNDELDRALFESKAGDCTLTLRVHSGPITDPKKLEAPVSEAYRLDLQMSEPTFCLAADAASVMQGQGMNVSVQTMRDGVTAARLVMDWDRARFAFDAARSKTANPGVEFTENGDGTVTVSRFGKAIGKGGTVADVCFTAVRTGQDAAAAADVRPFVISSARAAGSADAGEKDLQPVRAGGEQLRIGIGLNVAVFKNYAPGCDLVLLLADGSEAAAAYDGRPMPDVTQADWRVDGKGFSHVYGYVTPNADPAKVTADYLGLSFRTSSLDRQMKIDRDVDRSGAVDIGDVQAICRIARGTLPLVDNLEEYLLADVDRNGRVDLDDAGLIFDALR